VRARFSLLEKGGREGGGRGGCFGVPFLLLFVEKEKK